MIDPTSVPILDETGLKRMRRLNAERPRLKIHDIEPERIIPNGDRYIVEVVDFDEQVELGRMLVVTQAPVVNERDPMAPPQVEQRGVIGAIIITVGNGHLLGLADHAIVQYEQAPFNGDADDIRDVPELIRPPANVPMFYRPGDVVFIDHNARGRALMIAGRQCRVCNQVDVLAKVDGIRMKRTEEGGWERA